MWPGLVHASSEFLDQSAIRGVTLHGTIRHPPQTKQTGATPRRGRPIPSFLFNGRQMVAANQSLAEGPQEVMGIGSSTERQSTTSDSGVGNSDRRLWPVFCFTAAEPV